MKNNPLEYWPADSKRLNSVLVKSGLLSHGSRRAKPSANSHMIFLQGGWNSGERVGESVYCYARAQRERVLLCENSEREMAAMFHRELFSRRMDKKPSKLLI